MAKLTSRPVICQSLFDSDLIYKTLIIIIHNKNRNLSDMNQHIS